MKLYLEAVCDRLENHVYARRERADTQFQDRLDGSAQEAKWSVEVVKEEGIEALGEARGAALHECEDELVTLAATFEEAIGQDVFGCAWEGGGQGGKGGGAVIRYYS
jgi:hypothetical protein